MTHEVLRRADGNCAHERLCIVNSAREHQSRAIRAQDKARDEFDASTHNKEGFGQAPFGECVAASYVEKARRVELMSHLSETPQR